MLPTTLLLIGIAVSAAVVLLLRDWRRTFPALLFNYIFLTLFLAQQAVITPDLHVLGLSISSIILVKGITGLAVVAMLTLTAMTFSHEYGLEDLDEFGLAELRRAARAVQRQQATHPFKIADYVLPFWAMVLALIASLTLPRMYPIATSPGVDFAWYWLILTGLFTLATAGDLLKVGLGLLLSISSIDFLYTTVLSTQEASGVGIVPLAMLSLVTILLALVVSYLSGLLYGRLKTLELSELYKRI